jgi:hypothetical protein
MIVGYTLKLPDGGIEKIEHSTHAAADIEGANISLDALAVSFSGNTSIKEVWINADLGNGYVKFCSKDIE